MSRKINRSSWKLSVQLLFVIAAAFLVWGCGGGGSSYDAPDATRTATPLIDAGTLKNWMDQGLVNGGGFDNVVVLQVSSTADYLVGHIPGAQLWDVGSELTEADRLDGLAYDTRMVPNGSIMDEMIQRNGIDGYTTIVLSYASATNIYYPSRAYFTLRYWGFPKERIKFLNGGNNAWTTAIADNGWDAEYALTTDAPSAQTSYFSVKENGALCDDLRFSMGEMIQIVDGNNASVAASGVPEYNIIQQTSGTRTLSTAIGRAYGWFVEGGVTAGGAFLSAEEIEAVLADNDGPLNDLTLGDYDPDLPSITHCVSGMSCTPIFFAVDAILGRDIAVFDGSLNQWNVYRGDPAGSDPTLNDAWNVNINNRSTSVTAADTSNIIQLLNAVYQTTDDPRANQIETEDKEYMDSGSGSGAPTAGGGGDASGC